MTHIFSLRVNWKKRHSAKCNEIPFVLIRFASYKWIYSFQRVLFLNERINKQIQTAFTPLRAQSKRFHVCSQSGESNDDKS